MENVNIEHEDPIWKESDEEIGKRLAHIKLEAEAMGAGSEAELLIASVLQSAKLTHVKTGEFLVDNRNMIGAALGVGIGVGLELLSPTGSKTSALVAGIVGGGTLAIAAPILKAAPQTTGVAAAAGTLTSFVSMSAGRITADYFPGNLGDE